MIALAAHTASFRRLYYFGTLGYLLLVFCAGWIGAAQRLLP